MHQLTKLIKLLHVNVLQLISQRARGYVDFKSDAEFPLQEFVSVGLDTKPPANTKLTRTDGIRYFTLMSEMRKSEIAVSQLYLQRIIRGFCHLYNGQEAIAMGIYDNMQKGDSLITAYRCHAYAQILAYSPFEIISELAGRVDGCSRGKGGSMHIFAPPIFLGGHGIVGAHVPLGTGSAFAFKYNNTGAVCYCAYGDGAANQGQVYEAYNMAKLWNLPIVYICENNIYGLGTRVDRASANTNFYTRGECTSIPGIRCDGMDVISVRETMKFAREYAAGGKGPIIVEAVTYRYFGHSLSDPGTTYRTRDEIQEVRETRDCIVMLKNKLIGANLTNEEELKNIEAKIKTALDADVEKALKSPVADLKEIAYDIYCEPKGFEKIRGNHIDEMLEHKNIKSSYPNKK